MFWAVLSLAQDIKKHHSMFKKISINIKSRRTDLHELSPFFQMQLDLCRCTIFSLHFANFNTIKSLNNMGFYISDFPIFKHAIISNLLHQLLQYTFDNILFPEVGHLKSKFQLLQVYFLSNSQVTWLVEITE